MRQSGFARRMQAEERSTSGPAARPVDADDVYAQRMATALWWVLRYDVEDIDLLRSEIAAVRAGERLNASRGHDGDEIFVDSSGVRVLNDVLDIDLGDTPDGLCFEFDQLEDSLLWWREVAAEWWERVVDARNPYQ